MRLVILILAVVAAGCSLPRTVEETPPGEAPLARDEVPSPRAHAWKSRFGGDDPRRQEEYLSIIPEKRETLDTSAYVI